MDRAGPAPIVTHWVQALLDVVQAVAAVARWAAESGAASIKAIRTAIRMAYTIHEPWLTATPVRSRDHAASSPRAGYRKTAGRPG